MRANNVIKNYITAGHLFIRQEAVVESGMECKVFAVERIDKHEIFESCPLILFHKVIIDDYYRMYGTDRHILDDYLFKWLIAEFPIFNSKKPDDTENDKAVG